jgi:hypothetical protein
VEELGEGEELEGLTALLAPGEPGAPRGGELGEGEELEGLTAMLAPGEPGLGRGGGGLTRSMRTRG